MKNTTLNWDLSELYTSTEDSQIQKDFARAKELIEKIGSAYRGKISTLSPQGLLTLIKQWEESSILFNRLGLFAHLLEATKIGDAATTRFRKQIEEQTVQLGNELIFIETELAQLTEAQWKIHLNSPELADYRKFLAKLAIQSKHTLTESEEKILAEKSQTSSEALVHLYSVTTDTLAFPWKDGTITLEEVISNFSDPDPTVRKEAAMSLNRGLAENNKTTPAILNSLVQDKSITDRLRKYEYPEAARFNSDDVDRETVEAMVTAVNGSHELVERYYTAKKKILSLEKLYWWDRYAPLPETQAKIEQPEAEQMVLEAFGQFSPRFKEIAQQLIDEKHIDWMPSPTKRGGAFCAYGDFGKYPYVMLNHTAKPRDVMTVALELGHAIHDVFAGENNTFFQTHASLALAEIASTFGEALLFDKLIASEKLAKNDRLSLLMSNIEDRFATVFRQTTMFQFEQQLHARRRDEGELSRETLDEMWQEIMSAPFKSSLEYTDEHMNTWMYVAHIFHWPFYVYSYSFAQLCSLSLYGAYKEKGQDFVPTYIEILKAGGSLSPKDNLARAGLKIDQPSFWQEGLAVIEKSIEQLESLI